MANRYDQQTIHVPDRDAFVAFLELDVPAGVDRGVLAAAIINGRKPITIPIQPGSRQYNIRVLAERRPLDPQGNVGYITFTPNADGSVDVLHQFYADFDPNAGQGGFLSKIGHFFTSPAGIVTLGAAVLTAGAAFAAAPAIAGAGAALELGAGTALSAALPEGIAALGGAALGGEVAGGLALDVGLGAGLTSGLAEGGAAFSGLGAGAAGLELGAGTALTATLPEGVAALSTPLGTSPWWNNQVLNSIVSGASKLFGGGTPGGLATVAGNLLGGKFLDIPSFPLASFLNGITPIFSSIKDIGKGVGGFNIAAITRFLPEWAKGNGFIQQQVERLMPDSILATHRGAAKSTMHTQAMRTLIREEMVPPRYAAFRRASMEELLDLVPINEVAEIEAARDDPIPGDFDMLGTAEAPMRWRSEPSAAEAHAIVTGHAANKVIQAFTGTSAPFAVMLGEAARPVFMSLIELGLSLGTRIVDFARDSFGTLGEEMLSAIRDRLAAHGQILPGEQGPLVAELLGIALTLGTTAHLTAVAAEMAVPTKHMGLPQVAALMAELAGFAEITKAEHGPLLKQAIAVPAGYEAAYLFRPTLPDVHAAEDWLKKRLITPDQFQTIARYHGFRDEWMGTLIGGAWTRPRVNQIFRALDDSPIDEAWLRDKIAEAGIPDADIEKWHTAGIRVAEKSHRNALIGEVVGSYKDGVMTIEELQGHLDTMGLGPSAARLVVLRASLARRREHVNLLETALQAEGETGALSESDLQLQLQGLGLDADRIHVLAIRNATKNQIRQYREEQANLKKLIRTDQTHRIELAQESYRRRLINEAELHAMLVGIGLAEEYAVLLTKLEQVRREPVPRLPTSLSPEAQLQETEKLVEQAALIAYRVGDIGEVALAAVLAGTQFDVLNKVSELLGGKGSALAGIAGKAGNVAAIVAREVERKKLSSGKHLQRALAAPVKAPPKPPAPPKPAPVPTQTAEEKRLMAVTEQEARALYRAGLIPAQGAITMMIRAGTPEAIARALITTERVKELSKVAPAVKPTTRGGTA